MDGTGEKRVYLIDDDEPVRDSVRTLLETCDYRVEDYPSCRDFIDGIGGFDRPAEEGVRGCLLLDLHMPVMSGLEFMERHGADLRGMPVILITGRADTATATRVREAGVVAVLEKPFEDDDLLDTIERVMAGRELAA
ncbi:response regulator transcription factor [Azospirillum halopraeferens]|uniref:response regulator transcription factor n=1 Tax=Azospirillum halopraeferens TaxID=34010 RepID=UPI0003F59F72|nr:response regulator [Azospirillum halopraeferens]